MENHEQQPDQGERKNGHHVNPAVVQAEQIIAGRAQIVISAMVTGFFMSQQGMDPTKVAAIFCREVGRHLGVLIAGNLAAVLAARALMKQEFEAGLNSMKPVSAQQAQQPGAPPPRG